MVLKRTGILTARNSPPAALRTRRRRLIRVQRRGRREDARRLPDGDYLAAYARRGYLAARDHAKFAQPPLYHAQCVFVDHATSRRRNSRCGNSQPAGLAGVRESAPMHAEAGRSVDFAEQPQRDFVETSHAPSDALVVVDRVGRRRACIRRQLVRHQASGPSAVKQLAQTEIKAQSLLRPPEAGLVFLKHRSPFS